MNLNVIVDADTGKAPLGILEVSLWQCLHHRMLDRLEQLPAAHPEATHLAAVHPLHRGGDGGIALRQREEGHVAQPTKNVGLREPHPGFDSRLVARAPRPGGQDADAR